MLYIYVIQNRANSPDVYEKYLSDAVQCQSQISSIAEKGSLLDRYCLLLEELRLEAIRKVDRHRLQTTGQSAVAAGSGPSSAAVDPLAREYGDGDFAGNPSFDPNVNLNAAIPDQMSDSADWDQFASMISSGLGNLDAFLNADSFDSSGEFAFMQ